MVLILRMLFVQKPCWRDYEMRQLYAQHQRQLRRMSHQIKALMKLSWHERFDSIYRDLGGSAHPDISKIVQTLDMMGGD